MRTTTITSHQTSRITTVDGGNVAKANVLAEVQHAEAPVGPKARAYWTDKWDGGSMLSKETVLGERPAVTRRGDDPESDKAWDRYNKQHVRIVREAMTAALQEMVGYRYEVKSADVRYSRNAGCTCNCSPGFILSRGLTAALSTACGTRRGIERVDVTIRYFAIN